MVLRPSIVAVLVCPAVGSAAAQSLFSLRFHGHGTGDIDRVKIRIDAPAVPADDLPASGPGITGAFQARTAPAPASCPLP